MTDKHTRWTPLRSLILALVAVAIGVGACYVESPILIDDGDEEAADRGRQILTPSRSADAEPPSVPEPELPEGLDPVVIEEREAEPPAPRRPDVQPEDLSEEPTFTPFTSAPTILNRAEVIDAMNREYPPLLRDAGIGGTILVYFFVDEDGRVGDVRIHESSGHEALDRAALAVADVYRFAPAQNRGEVTAVWVMFPITFQVS